MNDFLVYIVIGLTALLLSTLIRTDVLKKQEHGTENPDSQQYSRKKIVLAILFMLMLIIVIYWVVNY